MRDHLSIGSYMCVSMACHNDFQIKTSSFPVINLTPMPDIPQPWCLRSGPPGLKGLELPASSPAPHTTWAMSTMRRASPPFSRSSRSWRSSRPRSRPQKMSKVDAFPLSLTYSQSELSLHLKKSGITGVVYAVNSPHP